MGNLGGPGVVAKEPTRIFYLSCPYCGLRRPLEKKGTTATMSGKRLHKGIKGLQKLGHIDVEKQLVIQRVKCLGHHGGFPVDGGMTLAQIAKDPDLAWLKDSMLEGARRILAELEGKGS
jgi:hypothetical protein